MVNQEIYNKIMSELAIEVKKQLNEKVSEAETKMAAWHNGTRKQNVKQCSDEKLSKYLNICLQNGYTEEAKQLQQEIDMRMYARKDDVYIVIVNNDMSYIKQAFDGATNIITGEVIDMSTYQQYGPGSYNLDGLDGIFQLAPGKVIGNHETSLVWRKSDEQACIAPARLDDQNQLWVYPDGDFDYESTDPIDCGLFEGNEPYVITLANMIESYEREGKRVHLFFLTDD